MKAYADLEQSRKLAEFLPLETADMFWEYHNRWDSEGDEWEGYDDYPRAEPYLEYTRKENEWKKDKLDIPCWSLAALLDVLPTYIKHYNYDTRTYKNYHLNLYKAYYCNVSYTFGPSTNENDDTLYCFGRDNFVDACVELIDKLHKQKLL